MKGFMTTALMVTGALGAAAAAAYFANAYIERSVQQRRAEIDSQYAPAKVVVANADLRPGVFLSGDTVAVRDVPRAFLHSDAVLAEDWSGVAAGRVLSHALRSGEPVLRSHLAQELGAGFSSQLREGMRAMTFPVDDESSIAGMLAPGDRIDIFFTTTVANSDSVTLPLLTNVPVIATGVRTATNTAYIDERRDGHYTTVTVSVLPEDAAKIAHAQDAGRITVTLRQPKDAAPVAIARITKASLLSNGNVAKFPPRARVEIILGGI
jgi:pilus assembly protein CpaB